MNPERLIAILGFVGSLILWLQNIYTAKGKREAFEENQAKEWEEFKRERAEALNNLKADMEGKINTHRVALDKKIDEHIEDNEVEHKSIIDSMNKIYFFKDQVRDTVNDIRLSTAKEIARVDAQFAVQDGRWNQVLTLITSMDKNLNDKMSRMETEISNLHKRIQH